MARHKLIGVVVAALFLTGAAATARAADDPSGDWTFEMTRRDQTVEVPMTLKADGEKLTGTVGSARVTSKKARSRTAKSRSKSPASATASRSPSTTKASSKATRSRARSSSISAEKRAAAIGKPSA